jgi:serine/threonine protein kinase
MPDDSHGTQCPDNHAWHQLVSGSLTDGRLKELEEHLTHCSDCQLELARITDLEQPTAVGDAVPQWETSGRLRDVMQQLRSEGSSTSRVDHAISDSLAHVLEPSDQPDSLGRLGQYDVLALLGQGGMGTVVKAQDDSLDRIVAIKILLPEHAAHANARERFVREAKAAASIHHPHVVTVHSVSESEKAPYLVMEYVAGETLADWIRRVGPLSVQEVERLAVDVIAGLEAAHKKGLVHRDIKPANVLIDAETESAKIADFGISKAVDDKIGLTISGAVAGTPEFMSPEQAAAHTSLDGRSDLFSVGTLLYFALTGVSPFLAESALSTLLRVSEEQPESLSKLVPDIPKWFEEVVSRLLKKLPAERYQSASEVATALRAGMSDGTGTIVSRRTPWAIAISLAIVGALLLSVFSGPPVADQAAKEDGVYIEGSDLRHESLAAAIELAAEGDTVVVYGNGEFIVDGVVIKNKSIAIRAAAGSLPTITSMPGRPVSGPALKSDSKLVIEGFQFRWPFDADVDSDLDRSVVAIDGGSLVLNNCAFEVSRRSVALGLDGAAAIRNSEFVHPDGIAILFFPSSVCQVVVENSTFEGKTMIGVTAERADASRSEIELNRNTVDTDSAVQVVGSLAVTGALRVSTSENLFNVSQVCGQVTRRQGRRGGNDARRIAGFKDRLRWTRDARNEYPSDCSFLLLERANREVICSIDDHNDWLKYWGLGDEPGSEAVGTSQAGADEETTGPGDGLERWRQSSEYADWSKQASFSQ